MFNNESTKRILKEVVELIPEDTEVYLFAGTIRNALYFSFFGEEMIQRDFDCIVIGNGEKFADNLINAGFVFGSKNSEKSKILKKPRTDNPIHQFNDWVYLDCKIYSHENTIEDVLVKITDFTLSGVALSLKDINSDDWIRQIISMPNALEDIKSKTIKIVNHYPLNIYKIIRLLSQGFILSEDIDIQMCVNKRTEATTERLKKEINKTINYVGGKEGAQKIIDSLGITQDILLLSVEN
jgi:hypothetical protein